MSANNTSSVQKGDGFEIIHRPNLLKAKVGPNALKFDAGRCVAQAEAAMSKLSTNFGAWLEQEMVAIEAARSEIRDRGLTPETAAGLLSRALDLKGLGVTYGYPLISRLAASLFKLVDEGDPARMSVKLIDAHVDAMRAIIRGDIRDAQHQVGVALATQLEQHVREHAAAVA